MIAQRAAVQIVFETLADRIRCRDVNLGWLRGAPVTPHALHVVLSDPRGPPKAPLVFEHFVPKLSVLPPACKRRGLLAFRAPSHNMLHRHLCVWDMHMLAHGHETARESTPRAWNIPPLFCHTHIINLFLNS
jgi:hypothetical protein